MPTSGTVFISIADTDKRAIVLPAARMHEMGFNILATSGTASVLRRNGIEAQAVRKSSEGRGDGGEPTVVDLINEGAIDMVVNTPQRSAPRNDGYQIRAAAASQDRPGGDHAAGVQRDGAGHRSANARRILRALAAGMGFHSIGGNAMTTFGIKPAASAGFGDRLYAAMRAYGPVCVGIDPHAGLLQEWGLDDDANGVREFSLRVIEALGGRVAAFKPQAAFFERHGSRGVAVLEEVIAACREVGTLCIVDAKRGDIGSTMDGYAEAFLSDSSPLAGDAVTLSPYLGVGSLTPALELARQTGRGVFVLALTSNPEGASVQHASGEDGTSVAGRVVSQLADFNSQCDQQHLGPAGIVVGATVGDAVKRLASISRRSMALFGSRSRRTGCWPSAGQGGFRRSDGCCPRFVFACNPAFRPGHYRPSRRLPCDG